MHHPHELYEIKMDQDDMRPLGETAANHIKTVADILDDATGGPDLYGKFDESILNEARTAAYEIDCRTLSLQRAYGLLWKSTATCPLTRYARKVLLESLSKDEQRAAVKWVVETYGPMTTADLIAADMRAEIFPERSYDADADAFGEQRKLGINHIAND